MRALFCVGGLKHLGAAVIGYGSIRQLYAGPLRKQSVHHSVARCRNSIKSVGSTFGTERKKLNSHCRNSSKSGWKWVTRTTKEIFHRYADQSQQVLQKKGQRLLVAASMDVLPRGSGNFGHYHFPRNFSNFLGENQQRQPANSAPTLISGPQKISGPCAKGTSCGPPCQRS